jgi:Transposase DDE domain
MRSLTRLGIIVESISKFLRELRRLDPVLHAQVDPDLVRKYVDREGDGCFASTKPSESKRRLPEAAADLLVLATQFRATEASELESFLILARVLSEQCEVVNDPGNGPRGRVKEPDEMTCDVVLNPADPDATYNKHRGVGYLVQVMETYCDVEEPTGDVSPAPPDLITHVAVGPMNVHDGSSLEPALADAEARGIKPKVVLADSHYGSNENLEKANLQGVEVVSPSMPPKGSKQEKLTLEHFELDEDGQVVRCPQGHAPVMTSAGGDKIQVLFDVATCAACPLHQSCCASAVDRKEPRYQYTHDRVRQRTRRRRDRSDEFRDRYRWRSGIEGTMSRFKSQMRMASLRIRGRLAVGYVTFLRALGLNIHRVAAYKAAC